MEDFDDDDTAFDSVGGWASRFSDDEDDERDDYRRRRQVTVLVLVVVSRTVGFTTMFPKLVVLMPVHLSPHRVAGTAGARAASVAEGAGGTEPFRRRGRHG
jgi:hypothetical protein